MSNLIDLVRGAAKVAENKKSVRIAVQDVKGMSDVCDYQLICSGTNEKQCQAICQGIEDFARTNFGRRAVAIEGKQTGNWILLDFGGVIVHIFNDSVRDYYAIDQLWPSAKSLTY